MNLYLLRRGEQERVDYDECDAFVVAAATEHDARLMASKECGYEGWECWLNLSRVICKKIASSTNLREQVVLRSFNAG